MWLYLQRNTTKYHHPCETLNKPTYSVSAEDFHQLIPIQLNARMQVCIYSSEQEASQPFRVLSGTMKLISDPFHKSVLEAPCSVNGRSTHILDFQTNKAKTKICAQVNSLI